MNKSLISYFVLLILLCAGFIAGARMMGEQGVYLAGGYMLTPAIAALLTRLFFHEPRFKDAHLRFGRLKDYIKFWLCSLAITAFSFALFTLFGAIRWDFSGRVFLDSLEKQIAATGQTCRRIQPLPSPSPGSKIAGFGGPRPHWSGLFRLNAMGRVHEILPHPHYRTDI